ncbi:MAG: DUF3365 domain-containing protein [Rhodospirillaceae bacterium]|nr:DUF3365 domain-containing protein [Rhodospirillaceae bacterium]
MFQSGGAAGAQTFRYLESIPTQPLCTVCRAMETAPGVAYALDRRNPEDRARGFNVGDNRGAFSIAQPAP